MRFHEYHTKYQRLARRGESQEAYLERANAEYEGATYSSWVRANTEYHWSKELRPYYSIYPVAMEMFAKVRLDGVPLKLLNAPLPRLLVRFPVGREPVFEGTQLRTMLLGNAQFNNEENVLTINYTTDKGDAIRGVSGFGIDLLADLDCEQAIHRVWSATMEQNSRDDRYTQGQALVDVFGLGPDMLTFAARVVLGVCLLGSDSELIEPDVLDKDHARWEESHDPKYIDKAHRRGKKGWTVGAHLETIPHVRRPHFGIRWTGKGGQVPKLVPISGSVVMRKKIGEMPTGYLDLESTP
jgi:hypothetical protein